MSSSLGSPGVHASEILLRGVSSILKLILDTIDSLIYGVDLGASCVFGDDEEVQDLVYLFLF